MHGRRFAFVSTARSRRVRLGSIVAQAKRSPAGALFVYQRPASYDTRGWGPERSFRTFAACLPARAVRRLSREARVGRRWAPAFRAGIHPRNPDLLREEIGAGDFGCVQAPGYTRNAPTSGVRVFRGSGHLGFPRKGDPAVGLADQAPPDERIDCLPNTVAAPVGLAVASRGHLRYGRLHDGFGRR